MENPVDTLTLEEIRDIYAGKITNWKQVGGEDRAIRIYAQDENSGLQTAFERQIMQGHLHLVPIFPVLLSYKIILLVSRFLYMQCV